MENRNFEQKFLSAHEVARALNTPDLTESSNAEHSIGILYEKLESTALSFGVRNTKIVRNSPIVPIAQHFDDLLFPKDAGVRSSLNSRYIDENFMLRGQTAANIPPLLREFAESSEQEILIVSPGICFRSEKNDRQHASVIHQVDIWYINKSADLDDESLVDFSESLAMKIAHSILPDYHFSQDNVENPERSHPYMHIAKKIKAAETREERPQTVLEYGTVNKSLMLNNGLDRAVGISMGVILERSVMLLKRLPDVRLLSSTDPMIMSQMYDLEAYKEPFETYEYTRDISISLSEDDAMDIQSSIEIYTKAEFGIDSSILVKSITDYHSLPPHIRERNGMSSDQVNILLSIKFTMTEPQTRAIINNLRDLLHNKFNASSN